MRTPTRAPNENVHIATFERRAFKNVNLSRTYACKIIRGCTRSAEGFVLDQVLSRHRNISSRVQSLGALFPACSSPCSTLPTLSGAVSAISLCVVTAPFKSCFRPNWCPKMPSAWSYVPKTPQKSVPKGVVTQ